MVDVLTDVHRSEGLLELQANNGSTQNEEYKRSVMAAVLVKHDVSRAQYDSSLVWYGQNLKYLVKVYTKVQKNINDDIEYWERIEDESKSEFSVSEAGDSVQIWTVDDYLMFNEQKLFSFRLWEIKSDSNYVAGDSIKWHIRVPHIPASHYLVATLSLNYSEEDSIEIYNTVVMRRDTSIELTCASDTSKVFESLFASLTLLKDSINVNDDCAFVDSLSMIRLRK